MKRCDVIVIRMHARHDMIETRKLLCDEIHPKHEKQKKRDTSFDDDGLISISRGVFCVCNNLEPCVCLLIGCKYMCWMEKMEKMWKILVTESSINQLDRKHRSNETQHEKHTDSEVNTLWEFEIGYRNTEHYWLAAQNKLTENTQTQKKVAEVQTGNTNKRGKTKYERMK